MDKLIKGDEVRQGKQVYLGALSKTTIENLSDKSLSDTLLNVIHDGSSLIFPTSAQIIAQSMKDAGEIVVALCLNNSHECIGIAQLHRIAWQARYTDLTIAILDESYFTSEVLQDAIQTMLQFVYWEANLNRVSMHCVEDNITLQQALEGSGFTNEGHLRQDVYRNGNYLDTIIYSILAREWVGNN